MKEKKQSVFLSRLLLPIVLNSGFQSAIYSGTIKSHVFGENTSGEVLRDEENLHGVSYGTSEPGARNTRWLQLPYMLSAILMVISTTMHWIVSQALFVVEVENQSGLPEVNGQSAPDAIIFAICYSPTAIFVIAIMAMALILGITIYYVIPFRSWMPFMAGSARVVFCVMLRASQGFTS